MNFVYVHPTVAFLGAYVSHIANPEHSSTQNSVSKEDEMLRMLAKYSKAFVRHVATSATAAGSQVVLLTGTTGGLGSVLLAKLLILPEVSRVYALNRKGSGTLLDRQESAFNDRALDANSLTSSKLVSLEGSLNSEKLGLLDDVYEEVGF